MPGFVSSTGEGVQLVADGISKDAPEGMGWDGLGTHDAVHCGSVWVPQRDSHCPDQAPCNALNSR